MQKLRVKYLKVNVLLLKENCTPICSYKFYIINYHKLYSLTKINYAIDFIMGLPIWEDFF